MTLAGEFVPSEGLCLVTNTAGLPEPLEKQEMLRKALWVLYAYTACEALGKRHPGLSPSVPPPAPTLMGREITGGRAGLGLGSSLGQGYFCQGTQSSY